MSEHAPRAERVNPKPSFAKSDDGVGLLRNARAASRKGLIEW